MQEVEQWLPGAGEWEKWGEVDKRVQTCSYKINKDLMYNMVTIVDNTVSYIEIC